MRFSVKIIEYNFGLQNSIHSTQMRAFLLCLIYSNNEWPRQRPLLKRRLFPQIAFKGSILCGKSSFYELCPDSKNEVFRYSKIIFQK